LIASTSPLVPGLNSWIFALSCNGPGVDWLSSYV
jgi:hypothetical protein